MSSWYVGSQHDAIFIIDKPPRPSTDDPAPSQNVNVIAKVADVPDAMAHATLLAAAPDAVRALENAPLPSVSGGYAEFLGRFYPWYQRIAKPAIQAARLGRDGCWGRHESQEDDEAVGVLGELLDRARPDTAVLADDAERDRAIAVLDGAAAWLARKANERTHAPELLSALLSAPRRIAGEGDEKFFVRYSNWLLFDVQPALVAVGACEAVRADYPEVPDKPGKVWSDGVVAAGLEDPPKRRKGPEGPKKKSKGKKSKK